MKTKINSLLKIGIILFSIPFLLLNCQKEEALTSPEQQKINEVMSWYQKTKKFPIEQNNFFQGNPDWEKAIILNEKMYVPFDKENITLEKKDIDTNQPKIYSYLFFNLKNDELKPNLKVFLNKKHTFFSDFKEKLKLPYLLYNEENKLVTSKKYYSKDDVEAENACETYGVYENWLYPDGHIESNLLYTFEVCTDDLNWEDFDNDDDGANGGGGTGDLGDTNSDVVQVIDSLTGKAKCVYKKMVDNKNNINWILENFNDGNIPSEFDLKLKMATDLPNDINGQTSNLENNTITIKINANTLSDRTALGLARTIIHEGIHARLKEFMYRKGNNGTSFPGIYDFYRFKNNWSHQQMASYYRSTIAKGLKQFDNGQHLDDYYDALAWVGLNENLKDNNNQGATYNTLAWDSLKTDKQNAILDIIKDEKKNGNKNCN